jgi:hypothetical protein
MSADVIEREEWLVMTGMIADVREELRQLTKLLRGDDDGEEEEEDA